MTTSTQWQLAREAADRYEQVLTPAILGPAAKALVDWSPLRGGETVIDVGCGTGAAARFAARKVGPSGRVIGIDVNGGMIEVASSLLPVRGAPIEWYQESAYQLPLEDQAVDASLCAQTLQFLNDRRSALSEMYRVLKPGGWAAFSLWCDIQESPYFHVLVEAVARHISPDVAAGLEAAFGLSNTEEIRSLLADAGFENIEMDVEQLDLQLPELEDFVPRHIHATPMAEGFDAADPAVQRKVGREVAQRLVRYKTETGPRIPFRTHLVRARRIGQND